MAEREDESVLEELTAFLVECDIEDYHLDVNGERISVAYREDFDALCLRAKAKPVKDKDGCYAFFNYRGWNVSGRINCNKPNGHSD
ncbi:MAG: hypothetical protein Q8L29_02435 [archaeon]|nr:hypothetical protein [archaeon]